MQFLTLSMNLIFKNYNIWDKKEGLKWVRSINKTPFSINHLINFSYKIPLKISKIP